MNEIINDKFELLEQSSLLYNGKNIIHYKVRCVKCGNIDINHKHTILSRKGCKSCKEIELQNNVGKRFGRLVVMSVDENRGRGHIFMNCVCDCGNTKNVAIGKLTSGHTSSCGCIRAEGNNYTHRLSNTRVYKIYIGMKTRCYNPNCRTYKFYGDKGVSICQEWLDDFMNFYNWSMSNGYTDELSIDRIDPKGNYEPLNCRWMTITEQQNNKSDTVYINLNEQLYTLLDISDMYNININDVRYRYNINELEQYLVGLENYRLRFFNIAIHNATHNDDYYNTRCGISK